MTTLYYPRTRRSACVADEPASPVPRVLLVPLPVANVARGVRDTMTDTIPIPDGRDNPRKVRRSFVEPDPRPRPRRDTLPGVSSHAESLMRRVPYGAFGPIREVPVSFEVTTIQKPRQVRDGSITDEMVHAVVTAFREGRVPEGQAAVICRNVEKENTARNRARTLATVAREKYPDGVKAKDGDTPPQDFAAHAIADPDNAGKFIGAVSLKPRKPATPPAKPTKPAKPAGN